MTSSATAAWIATVGLRGGPVLVVVEQRGPTTTDQPATPTADATGADPGPCRAIDGPDDLPIAITPADRAHVLDGEPLIGAAVSAERPGALVTWTAETILLSLDDGRRFDRVLAGPGAVRAAAIDCHGRVYALRALGGDGSAADGGEPAPVRMMLGVRHQAREAWRRIDFLADGGESGPRLVAGGGVVAIVGPVDDGTGDGLLAVSGDGGATWRFAPLDLSGSWESAPAIDVDPRGVVRVVSRWGDCMSDGSTLTRFDPATGASESTAVGAYPRGPGALDGDGWLYGRDWRCELCGWRRDEPQRALDGWRAAPPAAPGDAEDGDAEDGDAPAVDLVGDGTTVHALWHGELARLDGGAARWIATVPMERALAADRDGRILGLTADGGLVRWSPRWGVRPLRGQPRY